MPITLIIVLYPYLVITVGGKNQRNSRTIYIAPLIQADPLISLCKKCFLRYSGSFLKIGTNSFNRLASCFRNLRQLNLPTQRHSFARGKIDPVCENQGPLLWQILASRISTQKVMESSIQTRNWCCPSVLWCSEIFYHETGKWPTLHFEVMMRGPT